MNMSSVVHLKLEIDMIPWHFTVYLPNAIFADAPVYQKHNASYTLNSLWCCVCVRVAQ